MISAGETLSNSLAASGKAVVIAGNIFLAFDNRLLNKSSALDPDGVRVGSSVHSHLGSSLSLRFPQNLLLSSAPEAEKPSAMLACSCGCVSIVHLSPFSRHSAAELFLPLVKGTPENEALGPLCVAVIQLRVFPSPRLWGRWSVLVLVFLSLGETVIGLR